MTVVWEAAGKLDRFGRTGISSWDFQPRPKEHVNGKREGQGWDLRHKFDD